MKRFFASAAISVLISVPMAVFAVDGGLDMDGWGWVIAKPSWFSGEFGAEVSSVYLATSGTICDNRPVASQEFDWLVNLGDWGWMEANDEAPDDGSLCAEEPFLRIQARD